MNEKTMVYPLHLTLEELEEVAQLLPKTSTAKEKACTLCSFEEANERAAREEYNYKNLLECAAIEVWEMG